MASTIHVDSPEASYSAHADLGGGIHTLLEYGEVPADPRGVMHTETTSAGVLILTPEGSAAAHEALSLSGDQIRRNQEGVALARQALKHDK